MSKITMFQSNILEVGALIGIFWYLVDIKYLFQKNIP